MKIALIQNVPISDHRMVHTMGLAKELSSRGHEVEIIYQGANHQESGEFKLTPLEGDIYSIKGQISFMKNTLNYLRNTEYDILHCKNPFSSVIPCLFYRSYNSGTKIIYDMRGLWVDFGIYSKKIPKYLRGPLNFVDFQAMKRCDKVVSISNELKEILVNRGINEDQIKVITGDGVDIPTSKRMETRGEIVGYVGSISKSRGSDKILESFRYLTNLYDKEIRLLMVGPVDEADNDFFYNYINNHGLVDRVSFTGQVPHEEALEVMNGFKVAVSYHEGDFPFFNVAVPTKILEYMAAGCCIITTDHKMYRNMLKPEEAIFTKQNVVDFADGLKKALEDNELNRSLRKNAKKGAYRFSFSKIADQYEDVYESIMLG